MKENEQATPIPEDNQVINQDELTTPDVNATLTETLASAEVSEITEVINAEKTEEKKTTKKRTSKKTVKESSDAETVVPVVPDLTEEISGEEEVIHASVEYEKLNKEELVKHLEEMVKEPDTFIFKNQIGLIKVAFRKIQKEERLHLLEDHIARGGTIENFSTIEDDLDIRFNNAFIIYKENKTRQESNLEVEKQANLAEKMKILDALKNLVESEEELKKTYDAFKDIQERWKIIGQVPQKEKNNLWQNYHFLVEKFFAKVKINKELKDLDLRKNLEIKIELCEKTEELMLEPSIVKSFQLLQNYHESWKETGPVPPDKTEEIWQRFRNATEKINHRRQDYYIKLKEEQENNYNTKISLCEKMEQLNEIGFSSAKEWQDKSDEVNELQKLWKSIGYAPKKVNNEVWERFRTAINSFYLKKKDFFGKVKDEQTENYNQKINLCLQAEALKANTNWKQTTDELIKLQQEWKKIGPVPKKFSEKIWKRFRAACDEFFNNKSSYFSNIDKNEEENLKLKEEIIRKINEHAYGEDNAENLEILKAYQREWFEIGHVPIKAKETVQKAFRDALNKQYDRLKINAVEKVSIKYKSKIEHLKNQPDSKHFLSKEISFMNNKISSLKNDIKLWENNMGFLANSKNADLLKAEFDKKIENSRNEIKVLEEKLKILRETDRK
jgi:hypothetical protein